MIKKNYYRNVELFIESKREKLTNEYFNDYGYNLCSSRKNKINSFENYAKTNQYNLNKITKDK
ncbi:MAG: hypothetical protein PUD07_01415 [bacterium]|nr:hypothetical protein [bacterium]